MGGPLKIAVFNSSPKGDKGTTALLLAPFVEGARAAGAEVEMLYPHRLNIRPCLGDHRCWFRTPGACHQQDDMPYIYALARAAEVWVFAIPVYCEGMPGPLKNILDRTIALLEPQVEIVRDHCIHPVRAGIQTSRIVLLSTCGFWEMDNFEPLLHHLRRWCGGRNWDLAGTLLRPHASALFPHYGAEWKDVEAAATDAGRQIITQGHVSSETEARFSRTLLTREDYVGRMNAGFMRLLSRVQKS
jgi:multimeric flavodoxin WrbA